MVYPKSQTIDENISSLAAKQKKELESRGAPLLSTLVKLNLAHSAKCLEDNNLDEAEKFVLLAFDYLQQSFEEALTVVDKDLKSKILNSILLQQTKLIDKVFFIKISLRNSIDLERLKTIRKEVESLAVTRLFGRSATLHIYTELLLSLNSYMRNEKVIFEDNDEIILFINRELTAHEELSKVDRISIEWLKVRIYRQLVRQDRSLA